MEANVDGPHAERPRSVASRRVRGIAVVAGSAAVLAIGTWVLSVRAAHRVNRVPMSASPRPVAVVPSRRSNYRETRSYVGAVEPWVEATVGPQYISAYIETVLVRPGAVVHRGEVLATLDCSNPSAETRAVAMRARAIGAQMRAAADEATRLSAMLDGGFVAPNEVEQKSAVTSVAQAELLENNAKLSSATLGVRDCILRAPFDGEVGTRSYDPGVFVRPGASIVSVVDRDTVRVTVDAPEKDFNALEPSKVASIHLLATDVRLDAPIARRAPRADPKSRTIHFEIDVPDPNRQYPVGTTATVDIEVGGAVLATEIPTYAATQQEGKAKIFVVDANVAHSLTLRVLGETGGSLFFSPAMLREGTLVVTEGRALLSDGDRVRYRIDAEPTDGGRPSQNGGAERRGGGFGRPL